MPTLWQILTKKKEEVIAVENQHYNPLGVKIGSSAKIDTIDSEDMNFNIRSIQEWTRTIGDEDYTHADYVMVARPFGSGLVKKKIRLVPREDVDGHMTHNTLLLNLLDDFEYHEDFHKQLDFESNQGEFQEGDAIYWRVQDVREPYNAILKHISDLDGNGTVEEEEVKESKVTYWDFSRETEDEGKNKILEFYIVEMNEETGWFQIWVGSEIDQNRISI